MIFLSPNGIEIVMLTIVMRAIWPLFLGILFISLGNGLQGTLSSWRADYEGFSVLTTGLVMSGYFLGAFASSLISPGQIKKTGQIRTYAAFASIASTAILIQLLFIEPPVWFVARFLSGFCVAGIMIIVEGWLNSISSNENRGQLFSIHMMVVWGGLAMGQGLFVIDSPAGVNLFLLASILLSISLIPILLTEIKAPEVEMQEPLGFKALWKASPSGVATIGISGLASAGFFGVGTIYAIQSGLSISETALFMTLFIGFGALSQWPLGWLSDKIDRRKVILLCCSIVIGVCALLVMFDFSKTTFLVLNGLIGASTLPLYSLGVAQTNDRLKPSQMVSASGTIVFVFSVFAALGPFTMSYFLNLFDSIGFLLYLSLVHLVIGVTVFVMMFINEDVDESDQSDFQVMAQRPSMVAMEVIAEEAIESQSDSES
ncbi:MFS transporter [Candidatus Thioglobus sp.]|jgi:MFS family permease|nr:MFS transporter [Candidatus Thioglobus sp.]MDA8981373.1 MFS transporter [Candidatus Thioglobus sp.]MDA9060612.1 MFS transporter [Candidatus Thioglobus sp.]MDB9865159.1 MFS transporter [Candidatus Thioglobus sp.]|tara:strand:- start:1657 stop:2946 length:1290 start_codon:yes stop_codon:yes gene_type:complete